MTDQNTRPTPSSDVETIREYALELTRAFTGLAGGGSENFSREVGGIYLADIPAVVAKIRGRFATPRERASRLSALPALPAQEPSSACGCDGYSGDGCPKCEPHQHRTPVQVEVTDEMMKRATKAYHNAVISAPDETAGDRRQRVIRAALTAALTATDAKPLDDSSSCTKIWSIGNELHNIAIEHQTNEELAARLDKLACRLWEFRPATDAKPVVPAELVASQIEWLKARIAELQLPANKRDHDTREKFLLQCGMPSFASKGKTDA